MNTKKYLILGSNGFIGSNLYYFYIKQDGVIVRTNIKHDYIEYMYREIPYFESTYPSHYDLTIRSEVEQLFYEVKPDVVIHAAAVTTGSKDVVERPYLHVTDNVCMNSLVLEQCYKHNVKHTIFLSCTVMYQSKEEQQSEADWKPQDEIYDKYFGVGNMKVFTEKLCEFYSRLPNAGKFTAIRHSNVYGPNDKFDLDKCHVIPAMIRKVLEAKGSLEIWGEGKAKRDVVYIDDLVNFIDLCVSKQQTQYELFNCGSEVAYPILDIIKTIQVIADKADLKLNFDTSKPDIPTTVVLNCNKAKNILGWEPQISLLDGLRKTISWYQKC